MEQNKKDNHSNKKEIIMNPSQKKQNELNPNIPSQFVTLTEKQVKFAEEVYINERDPKEVYIEMGLDIYDNDYNTMGKYKKKKGERKSEQQIQLGVTRLLADVKEYGEYIKDKKQKEYEKSESYSKQVALETCLMNIQIARDSVKINHEILTKLNPEDPTYLRQAQRLSSIISAGQKTILDYLKELNRLQHLYNKDGGDDDKVTLVFNDDVER